MRVERIGNAVLYCCDYRSMLSETTAYDIVTDPPYGIGFRYDGTYNDSGGNEYHALIRPLLGRRMALLQYPIELMRDVVPILGAPNDVLAWVYPSNLRGRHFRLWGLWGLTADLSAVKQPARNPEANKVQELLVNSYTWWEQPQVKNTTAEKTAHPCQVPETCVERVIRLCGIQACCDPFLGSGTAGVVCVRMGIPFIGCEIHEPYFDIACRRIEQSQRQGDLFRDAVA
jgi:hypothetical protein